MGNRVSDATCLITNCLVCVETFDARTALGFKQAGEKFATYFLLGLPRA
jgi:hypothetical protein